MTREDKINSIIPIVNSLTNYMNYYLVQCYNSILPDDQKPLQEDDLYKIAVSFIQLNMLLLKENIIENKGSLVYESKIYEEILTQAMVIIANINSDGTFTISNKTATKEEMFSFIRNKLAHGDYYYDDTNKAIVLNSDTGDVVININLFIQFYNMLIPMLYNVYKDSKYTKNIL